MVGQGYINESRVLRVLYDEIEDHVMFEYEMSPQAYMLGSLRSAGGLLGT